MENNKYDVVIVGSGLGGLICGAILAKQGKNVCVLEKHHQIGGNLQVFTRKNCHFSAGMHYAGSLAKGQVLQKVFSYLGIYEKLSIRKLDENCFEKIYIGDKEYSYAMGKDNFKQNLINYFPSEEKAIDAYTEKLEDIWNNSDLLNLREVNTKEMPQFDEYNENAYSYINSITQNEELRAVLAATNGLYVGNKEKTPLYIHANINKFFINSAWRIAESSGNIADLLADIIKCNGGKVIAKSEIVKFEFEGSEIKSALTINGDKYNAETFISNIHPLATIRLIEPGKFRKAFVHRVENLENSVSSFTLYMVLKKKTFKHINSNVYFSKDTNVWDTADYQPKDWPRGYMLYTTEDEQNKGYAESIVVIGMMKFEDVKEWENTTIEKRGDAYKRFKKEKSKELIDLVALKFPKVNESIDEVYSASPLTYRDYTNTRNGSIYGIVKDCNDPLRTFLSPRTKIPNLLLTGQNLSLHGMLGVIMTSFQTCTAIIDINKLFSEIRKQ